MSSDTLAFAVPVLGLTAVFDVFALYGAYLSISVRRGLVVPIYRGRALWLAVIGLLGVLGITYFGVAATLNPVLETSQPALLEFLYLLPLAAILTWIDRTVNTVIRLDYLRRDVLFWRRLRFAYGLVAVIGILIYYARYFLSIPDARIVGFALIFSQLIYGMLALVRGARVTRDMTFKSHVRWSGFFLLAFIVAGFIYVLGYSNPSYVIPALLSFVAASFGIYRMAKSLVPTSKRLKV